MKGFSKIAIMFGMPVILLGAGLIFYFFQRSQKLAETGREETSNLNLAEKKNMKLISSAFENNELIPQKYTCDGEDVNPSLEISEVPEGTKSLVLIVDDPDAPTGTFDHWVVWNINPLVTLIKENSLPEGAIQGTNSAGKQSYFGPCPPKGSTHHYHFKIYAIDEMLNIDTSSKKNNVENAMENHVLGWTELIGLYQRK